MPDLKKPIVVSTHKLPGDWISTLYNHCSIYSGPADATEFDPMLIELLPEARGLLSLLTIPITGKILDLAPNLRVVSNMAVGVDNIDIKRM